ncbi:RNA polymerase II-associated [Chytridium lagenaria]|nr:RNA polymerase II-associated [Chytridium lagenaria]
MSKPAPSQKRIGQDFPCSISYLNPLPPLPFEPKLLKPNFPPDRHYKDVYGSIHITTPIEIHGKDNNLGMKISPLALGLLWKKESFTNKRDLLDPKDKELLAPYKEPVEGEEVQTAKSVASWLRRSEVVSNDFAKAKVDPQARLAHKALQKSPPKKYADLRPRDQIIKMVEETFEAAAKANLSTSYLFFPDFENYPNRYSLMVYDADPAHGDKPKIGDQDLFNIPLEEAILKSYKNETTNEEFMSYYAPTAESINKIQTKRLLFDEDDEDDEENVPLEYEHVRDFTYKSTKSENEKPFYFIEIREEQGGAFYSSMDTKFSLSKKRAQSKLSRRNYDDQDFSRPTHYRISPRPHTKSETRLRRTKLREILLRKEIDEAEDDGDDDEEGDEPPVVTTARRRPPTDVSSISSVSSPAKKDTLDDAMDEAVDDALTEKRRRVVESDDEDDEARRIRKRVEEDEDGDIKWDDD